MAQHAVTLPIIKNGYISKRNEYKHYSVGDYLISGLSYTESPYVYRDYRIVLGFDKSLYPVRKKIVDSVLHYYLIDGVTQYKIHTNIELIRSVAKDWNESTVTYNNCTTLLEESHKDHYSDIASGWRQLHFTNKNYINGIVLEVGKGFYDTEHRVYSRTSSYAPYIVVTYEDVPPDSPTLIIPIGNYVNNFSTIRFEWSYNSSVGGIQKKFDLQWSNNNGSSWNTVTQTTANNYYDMPANTLPTGNIMWRVRTYNEYNEVGAYSENKIFYSVGAPETPFITTVENNCRPIIQWGSFNQQLYQVQIKKVDKIIYDSNNIASVVDKQYKIPIFLDDGDYIARIRIKNEYDFYSQWGEKSFTISTTKPSKPDISLTNNNKGISIISNITDTEAKYIVYRKAYNESDYISVGYIENNKYDDFKTKSNELYSYFIRLYKGNSYNDSEVKTMKFLIKNHDFYDVINNESVTFKYQLSPEGKPTYYKNNYSINYYNGRTYPVFNYSPHKSLNYSFEFFAEKYNDVERLITIHNNKNIVLYRNDYIKDYGYITDLTTIKNRNGFIVKFNLNKAEYNEELEV